MEQIKVPDKDSKKSQIQNSKQKLGLNTCVYSNFMWFAYYFGNRWSLLEWWLSILFIFNFSPGNLIFKQTGTWTLILFPLIAKVEPACFR